MDAYGLAVPQMCYRSSIETCRSSLVAWFASFLANLAKPCKITLLKINKLSTLNADYQHVIASKLTL